MSSPPPNPVHDVHQSQQRQGSYRRLAALMARLPELAVFRQFRELNALNLLSLQSELAWLEADFRELCAEDAGAECPVTRLYQCDFRALGRAEGKGGGLQRDMLKVIGGKLESYNTALLQRVELGKQAGPSQHDLELLRRWLISSKGNNGDLQGPGFDIWKEEEDVGEECAKVMDFVVLSAKHTGRDSFLSWMEDKGFHILHRLFGCLVKKSAVVVDEECGLVEYKDRGILTVVNVISTLLASLLVTTPMVVLYFVHDLEKRLGIVMGSTVMFSLALLLFSEAKRIEMFAATAAFAAVQVVFIGSIPVGG